MHEDRRHTAFWTGLAVVLSVVFAGLFFPTSTAWFAND
jgi:hypothetical protein